VPRLWTILHLSVSTILLDLLSGPVGAQSSSELIQFLRNVAKANEGQLAAVELGKPLALDLASEDKTEIALISAVKINVTPDSFISQYRDIARFKESEEVLEIGKLVSHRRNPILEV
jgi:hypothetical protein